MFSHRFGRVLGLPGLLIVLSLAGILPGAALAAPGDPPAPVEVSPAQHADISRPLREMAPAAQAAGQFTRSWLFAAETAGSGQPDGALQTSTGPQVATIAPAPGFAGVGQGDYGYTDRWAPPDTNGAVGATQYVQWVNADFAVFDKNGNRLLGPVAGNTLWSGFGGGCQTNNDGDPIVQYDKQANRWVFTQFSVSTKPYVQCVAVSTTSDATGSYNRYSFSFGNTAFPDYPKLGVWADGYYISFNIFRSGRIFQGAKVCAYDRTAMLTGTVASQQCFPLSSSYASLLPSDLDGGTPPPAGSPNYFLNYGTNAIRMWKFHVDWANSANSTFTGPTSIPVAAFTAASGTSIPQLSSSQRLDSLGDRLMYRLAYRNRSGVETLVVNHSVMAGSSVAPRWYELRNGSSGWSVYQQGTFAPDATYRWMGSIAMDKVGDLALGYSKSSSGMYPAIYYTGRTPADQLGTMEGEAMIKAGGGSQQPTLSRWGDYSSMTVDPVDDCTFWYTNEYLKTDGTFNWSTWIYPFKFSNCQ